MSSRGLIKSTAIVSSMTLLSRILGLIRDLVLGWVYGASWVLDAFFVAFKIPNMLRRFFGEGAFSLAFVPVLSEYKEQRRPAEVAGLVSRVAGTLAPILLLISILGSLAAPLLVMLIAPGFLEKSQQQFDLTAAMLSITFPYILFISLVAFAGSILNTYGRFAAPAFAPVLLNILLISAATLAGPWFEQPIMAMAWAVFIAGMVQLLFVLPGVFRLRLVRRPVWGGRDPGVRRILKLMGPAILGSSVAQINMLFDTLMASFLAVGSVSWLYFADRMVEFPLGVFGIALSTVILPSLSRQHAKQDREQFCLLLDRALRWVFLLGVPAALGLMWLAEPIILTLFQHGAFSPHSAHMTALALMAYTGGLPALILVKVMVPAFYSRHDARTPVRIGIQAMLANMALNVVFVLMLLQLGFAAPHAGLALATSVSAWLNAGLLYRQLRRADVYRPRAGWLAVFGRILLAGAAMSVLLGAGVAATSDWISWTPFERTWQLGLWIAGAACVYLLVLQLLGQRLQQLWRRPAAR